MFGGTRWEVEFTDQFGDWFEGLSGAQRSAVVIAVEALEELGPGLGRPFVDTIKSSRHSNMKELRPLGSNLRILFKELRPLGSNLRILFAFDPRRTAILLIGGDKFRRWNDWCREIIPVADDLYDEYLETLQDEGLLP